MANMNVSEVLLAFVIQIHNARNGNIYRFFFLVLYSFCAQGYYEYFTFVVVGFVSGSSMSGAII